MDVNGQGGVSVCPSDDFGFYKKGCEMEHQQLSCPRCHNHLLLEEEGGTYRCSACGTRFYRGAVVRTAGSQFTSAVYRAPGDPLRPPVHLISQYAPEPGIDEEEETVPMPVPATAFEKILEEGDDFAPVPDAPARGVKSSGRAHKKGRGHAAPSPAQTKPSPRADKPAGDPAPLAAESPRTAAPRAGAAEDGAAPVPEPEQLRL